LDVQRTVRYLIQILIIILFFIDFFKKVGDYCKNNDLIIYIENNSKKYNYNYINIISKCAYLVRQINKKNIKMMVDLGNTVMKKDDWYNLKEYIDKISDLDYNITDEDINIIKNNMENDVKIYIPDFLKKFNYQSYFISYKCKTISNNDTRFYIIEKDKNIISVNCGKIIGIFDFENYQKNVLQII
jgi:hypothetical protein